MPDIVYGCDSIKITAVDGQVMTAEYFIGVFHNSDFPQSVNVVIDHEGVEEEELRDIAFFLSGYYLIVMCRELGEEKADILHYRKANN